MSDLARLETDFRLILRDIRARRLVLKRISKDQVKKRMNLPIDEVQMLKNRRKDTELRRSIWKEGQTIYRYLEKCYRTPQDIFRSLPRARTG